MAPVRKTTLSVAISNAHNDRKTTDLKITRYRPIFAKVVIEDEAAADRIVYVTGSKPTQSLLFWDGGSGGVVTSRRHRV